MGNVKQKANTKSLRGVLLFFSLDPWSPEMAFSSWV